MEGTGVVREASFTSWFDGIEFTLVAWFGFMEKILNNGYDFE